MFYFPDIPNEMSSEVDYWVKIAEQRDLMREVSKDINKIELEIENEDHLNRFVDHLDLECPSFHDDMAAILTKLFRTSPDV